MVIPFRLEASTKTTFHLVFGVGFPPKKHPSHD